MHRWRNFQWGVVGWRIKGHFFVCKKGTFSNIHYGRCPNKIQNQLLLSINESQTNCMWFHPQTVFYKTFISLKCTKWKILLEGQHWECRRGPSVNVRRGRTPLNLDCGKLNLNLWMGLISELSKFSWEQALWCTTCYLCWSDWCALNDDLKPNKNKTLLGAEGLLEFKHRNVVVGAATEMLGHWLL